MAGLDLLRPSPRARPSRGPPRPSIVIAVEVGGALLVALVAWLFGCAGVPAATSDASRSPPPVERLLPGPTSAGLAWQIDSDWHREALRSEAPEAGLAPCSRSAFEHAGGEARFVADAAFGRIVDAGTDPSATRPASIDAGALRLPQRASVALTLERASPVTPYVVRFALDGAQRDGETRVFVIDLAEEIDRAGEPAALERAIREPGRVESLRRIVLGDAGASGEQRPEEAISAELLATDGTRTHWRASFSSHWRTRMLAFAVCGSEAGASALDDWRVFELPARALLGLPEGAPGCFDLPRPWESLDPATRTTKVRAEWESRRALLLPRGGRARASVALPEARAGARIELGVAIVREERLCLRGPRRERVRVRLGRHVEEIDLALEFERPGGWHDLVLTLPQDGASAELAFEVLGEDDAAGALIAFSDPLLVVPAHARPADGTPPLNVVVVSLDTLRADRLGKRVGGRSLTPRLDALGARSVACTSALANASYTLPSHVSLFSSQRPGEHGVLRVGDRFDAARSASLARVAAERGFATAAFTSGGMLNAEFCGIDVGFDRFGEIDPLLTPGDRLREVAPLQQRAAYNRELAARRRLDAGVLPWIEAHRDVPFLLFVHSYLTHNYQPEPELRAAFTAGLPPTPFALHGPVPYRGLLCTEHLASEAGRHDRRFSFAGDGPHEFVPERDLPWVEALYDATVAQADRDVGRLLDALERAGLLERTLVVVTSDHGEEFLEHGDLSHARTLYDEILRVPLLIHAPGVAPRTLSEPVELIDVMPTLLARLGWPCDPRLRGEDLLAPGFEARDVTIHEGTESGGKTTLRAARTRGAKLILDVPLHDAPPVALDAATRAQLEALGYLGGGATAGSGFFDLRTDPREAHDLAASDDPRHEAQLEALAQRLLAAPAGGHGAAREAGR